MKKFTLEIGVKLREFTPEEMFSLAKDSSVDGLDYIPHMHNLIFDPIRVANLNKLFNKQVVSIHEPLYLIPYAPSLLFERMIRIADFFPQADTYIVHLSSVLNVLQNDPNKVLSLSKIAEKRGVRLAIESNPPFFILKYYPKVTLDPDIFAAFCIKHKLKMTLDTSHIAAVGGDIVAFYKKYYKNIIMIHLSDYHNGVEHLPLGEGSLPITRLLEEVKKTKYSEKIYLEINTFPKAKNKNDKIKALKKSIAIVNKHLH